MAKDKRKPAEPKVLGPFEAATPPDTSEDEAVVQRNLERLNRVRQSDMVRERSPSPEMQRKLQAEQDDARMQKEMDRAAEMSRRSSMGTLKEKSVKKARGGMMYAKGGSVGSASKRADGCAMRGKTRGKMV